MQLLRFRLRSICRQAFQSLYCGEWGHSPMSVFKTCDLQRELNKSNLLVEPFDQFQSTSVGFIESCDRKLARKLLGFEQRERLVFKNRLTSRTELMSMLLFKLCSNFYINRGSIALQNLFINCNSN